MRQTSWFRRIASVLLAVMVTAMIGEAAAAKRDRGGFPHFNGYRADKELGLRLKSNFDTSIAFKKNPVGKIHVNTNGYRGKDWPTDRAGEIVMIGDSQVFGLGVNDNETAAFVLGKRQRWPVINMGVPTYGPFEYLAMIDEAAKRSPREIVVVLNFGNDIFELDHPNRSRHVVLDGWALRGGKLPSHTNFPGREWLFGRSHLMYAIRQLRHRGAKSSLLSSDDPRQALKRNTPATGDPTTTAATSITVPPTAATLPPVPTAEPISLTPPISEPATGTPPQPSNDVTSAIEALRAAEDAVYALSFRVAPIAELDGWAEAVRAARQGAQVGDIYYADVPTEAAPQIPITAAWLRAATDFRVSASTRLQIWIDAHSNESKAKKARSLLQKLGEARRAYEATTGFVAGDQNPPSAFRSFIAEVKRRAGLVGAELTIVGLPLDVQVDSEQFKKYGEKPQDLSATLALLTDLCRDATQLGTRCLNATDSLRKSGSGTFLDGDLHLTSKGQESLAGAIATTLTEPIPHPTPFLVPEVGRTRFPTMSEWQTAKHESLVPFADDNATTDVPSTTYSNSGEATSKTANVPKQCRARSVREYLRVDCRASSGTAPTLFDNVRSAGADYPISIRAIDGPLDRTTWIGPDSTGFIMPRDAKHSIVVDIFWTDGQVDRVTVPSTAITDAMNVNEIGHWDKQLGTPVPRSLVHRTPTLTEVPPWSPS